MSKLSISQIYGLSGSVYRENFVRLLLPVVIPTLLMVGVSAIFYTTTLPTLVIEDITQYYSFSSYQALETILGTWYDIFVAAIAVYILMVIYAFSAITGIISEGLMTGSLSVDVGARKGTSGFIHAIVPVAVLVAVTYYLLTSYGRLSIVVPLIMMYFGTYLVSSSVVDGAFVFKNVFRSLGVTARNPIFTLVGGAVVWVSIEYLPEFIFVITPAALMFVLPYVALINTIAYLSLKA